MAYLDTKNRPSAASMAAVIAIHGAVGAALILGLTISGTIVLRDPPPNTFDIPKPSPPPSPKPEIDKREAELPRPQEIPVPVPPLDLTKAAPDLDVTNNPPLPLPPMPSPNFGEGMKPVLPTPKPASSFVPTAATPRNDPAGWVTTEDYRGNWIRRGLAGKASFKLDISAEGRVTNCAITASSGHSELDGATCTLVTRRARFQPARNGSGEAIGSSYSNTIVWRLPE